jgi:hypothetical protein
LASGNAEAHLKQRLFRAGFYACTANDRIGGGDLTRSLSHERMPPICASRHLLQRRTDDSLPANRDEGTASAVWVKTIKIILNTEPGRPFWSKLVQFPTRNIIPFCPRGGYSDSAVEPRFGHHP